MTSPTKIHPTKISQKLDCIINDRDRFFIICSFLSCAEKPCIIGLFGIIFIFALDMHTLLPVFYTCLGTFLINIPFGFLRAGYRKLSFMWFLFIHLPVPLVILIRHLNGINLSWTLAPFLFGSYFLGQWIGKTIRQRRDLYKKSI